MWEKSLEVRGLKVNLAETKDLVRNKARFYSHLRNSCAKYTKKMVKGISNTAPNVNYGYTRM